MGEVTIICLTPVKNEEWILDKFLSATSQWADHIIIADQNSTDRSREIASGFPKVRLIENSSESYNEAARQVLLLQEARKIEGQRLIITLDADEFFTPGFRETGDWKKILSSPRGSVFGFKWINVLPGFKRGWYSKGYFPWAMMDDGLDHDGAEMHNPRIPVGEKTEIQPVSEFHVLHLQYLDWNRMKSKQRYYQCLERIKYPDTPPVSLYRKYHHMYSIDMASTIKLNPEWTNEYRESGTDLEAIVKEDRFWYDDEVRKLIAQEGAYRFRKDAIWEKRWGGGDPRNFVDRIVHLYWRKTQSFHQTRMVQKIDRYLKFHY